MKAQPFKRLLSAVIIVAMLVGTAASGIFADNYSNAQLENTQEEEKESMKTFNQNLGWALTDG